MLNRFRLRRSDEGQGLVIVIAVVAIAAIVIGALEVSVIGDAKLAATSTNQEQALQAAQTGLADYQTNVNGSASQWQYAMNFCSAGTFGCVINGTNVYPDPNNLAYSGIPDPHCSTSAYNATQASPGAATYFGWVTVHGSTTGGFSEQFQYVVDSSSAKALGGYAHIWITGRAGSSGRYVCSTIKALYNGPKLTSVSTVQLSPAACLGLTIPVVAPTSGNAIARVLIEATGGAGQTGGSLGMAAGGGTGGSGETVEATYAASNATTLYVNMGCQAGSSTSIIQGGLGFAAGGSVASGGNSGGGGGATGVCSITPCTAGNISNANLASDVYMIVGGGGGGGEGVFAATPGGGKLGSGVTTSVTSGVTEDGNDGASATAWGYVNGGTGGAGGKGASGYVPAGGAGAHKTGIGNADGGGGGGGYNGADGGTFGFGGGGGGSGASFYNTNTAPSGPNSIGANIPTATGTGFVGTGTKMVTTPANYGSVIIQWQDASGAPVGPPVVPAVCGPTSERTTTIPALSNVSLQVSGGNGGNGADLASVSTGVSSGAGTQGLSATIIAMYKNTSTLPVAVTVIQGCQGSIGGGPGVTPGGDGLETPGATTSGGNDCTGCTTTRGDGGSGGGASAICVGTVAPGADSSSFNNCTGAGSLLMVAGGGGGGGGLSDAQLSPCSAGKGGDAGMAPASNWPMSLNLTTGGVAGTNGIGASGNNGAGCSAATGGTGGSANLFSYAPTGADGSSTGAICSGDGGAAGGGMVGGAAGVAGTGTINGGSCQKAGAGGGGGGGSSYLSPGTGSLVLQQCPPLGQCLYSACPTSGESNSATNQTNTSNQAVYEGEWCLGQQNATGSASITQTAIPNTSSVLSQSPTPVPSTPGSVLW